MHHKNHLVTLKQNHMATTFEFSISCPKAQIEIARQTLKECHALVTSLENDLSEFIKDSAVARLNHSKSETWMEIPTSFLELLEQSDYLKKVSFGAFDCTAKSKGPSAIEWKSETRKARRLNDSTWIGFGAIGKGYAIDKVAEKIEREGFTNYLLVAGGSSIRLNGFLDDKTPWRWGWRGQTFTHTSGKPVSIGVTGLEEKGEHVIDPRKGQTTSSLKSALIAHPSAAYSDALSTALFVLNWEEALSRFQALNEKPAMAIFDHNEVARWNGNFQNLWGSANSASSL